MAHLDTHQSIINTIGVFLDSIIKLIKKTVYVYSTTFLYSGRVSGVLSWTNCCQYYKKTVMRHNVMKRSIKAEYEEYLDLDRPKCCQ